MVAEVTVAERNFMGLGLAPTRELVRRLRILGDVQREFRGESMKNSGGRLGIVGAVSAGRWCAESPGRRAQ
jgi:hypothetical protein